MSIRPGKECNPLFHRMVPGHFLKQLRAALPASEPVLACYAAHAKSRGAGGAAGDGPAERGSADAAPEDTTFVLRHRLSERVRWFGCGGAAGAFVGVAPDYAERSAAGRLEPLARDRPC